LPIPAARGLTLEPSVDSSRAQPDTHTLSSIEKLGIGSLGAVRSVIDPSFTFGQAGDTAIAAGTNSSSTSLGVNLAFDQNWSRTHLTGFYSGAQVLYYPNSAYNTAYHNLAVSQEIRRARWLLRLRDDLLVSPEASFGGLDIGGFGLSGGASALNSPQLAASAFDTILTQRAKRIRNTASAEVNYSLSRRSIVTFAGTYESLNFMDAGFINSYRVTGRAGYDYALTPKDTIALMYDYGRTAFNTGSMFLQTHSVQLSYGHRVTGRLAFQIAAGPQLLRTSLQSRSFGWTVTSATIFETRRSRYSLSYSRTPSGGSGVFLGADSHTVTATMRHALTPSWLALLGAGYAFNKNLAPVTGVVNHFGNAYGSADLQRIVSRHFRVDLSYRFQRQDSGTGTCPVLACGSTQSRHTIGITLGWHPWSLYPR
jgi:hypothetical protein